MSSPKAERARRMLVLLRHLQPDTEIELTKLAGLVGATPDEVAADVTTLSMCGVAPYDPLNLVAAFVDEGRVIVMGPPPALDRPVRLSSTEARALATALQSAGFDAQAGLVERLMQAASLDFSAEELARRLQTGGPGPAHDVYETLSSAAAEHVVARIEYQRAGEVTAQKREIEPAALFNDRGTWYVSAHCRSADDSRTFRLDRIRSASMTGEVFVPRGDCSASTAFVGDELPRARLVFTDAATYSEREWPGATSTGDSSTDGSLAVDVPYSGTAWIARQVCSRLGTVTVESPDEVRDAVAAASIHIADELGHP